MSLIFLFFLIVSLASAGWLLTAARYRIVLTLGGVMQTQKGLVRLCGVFLFLWLVSSLEMINGPKMSVSDVYASLSGSIGARIIIAFGFLIFFWWLSVTPRWHPNFFKAASPETAKDLIAKAEAKRPTI